MKSTVLPREIIFRLFRSVAIVSFALQIIALCGCQELTHNTRSLLLPRFERSDIFGFVAGLGTTFAVLPDLVAMLRRRSIEGMNPRMAAIIGCFQILWVYYGVLIVSKPVVAWNVIGVLINFFTVGAYVYFRRKDKARAVSKPQS
jgi:MtN3 and saliva related transmembrane protein